MMLLHEDHLHALAIDKHRRRLWMLMCRELNEWMKGAGGIAQDLLVLGCCVVVVLLLSLCNSQASIRLFMFGIKSATFQ